MRSGHSWGIEERIGTPHFLALEEGAHHDVLTGAATVLRVQRRGDLERDLDRVLGIRGDLQHLQGMKLQHLRCT
jgi:hypothetical protein